MSQSSRTAWKYFKQYFHYKTRSTNPLPVHIALK